MADPRSWTATEFIRRITDHFLGWCWERGIRLCRWESVEGHPDGGRYVPDWHDRYFSAYLGLDQGEVEFFDRMRIERERDRSED